MKVAFESKERVINEEALKKYNQLLLPYISDPMKLLPKNKSYEVNIRLTNTHSAFANALRRVLTEELPVYCLSAEEKDIETNDEFILKEVLIKNINLIPINQEIAHQYTDEFASLTVENNTNNIIDVKIESMYMMNKLQPLCTDDIILIRLRPGKFINIRSFTILRGKGSENAARFSLLGNVKHAILDMVPFDVFTNTGTRSIEYDPKDFLISFRTVGNILPSTVVKLLTDELTERLIKCKHKLELYAATDMTKYYFADNLEVSHVDNMQVYKITNEYITIAYLLAQRCFLLDGNVAYCVPSVDRYDNNIAIIKIIHPTSCRLLIDAINSCVADIALVKNAGSKLK